jgi:hypothetical protein
VTGVDSSARDRAIEAVRAAIHRPMYAGESTASNAVDALLANPEVLRALAGEAGAPDTPPADDVPAVWWSPTLGLIEKDVYEALPGVPLPTTYAHWSGEDWESIKELPSDAVRLVPAAATTPTDEIEIDGHDLGVVRFPAPGQLVNENLAGVVLRHVPTGIEVSCSSERTALQNEVKALAELRAVLARRTEEGETNGR